MHVKDILKIFGSAENSEIYFRNPKSRKENRWLLTSAGETFSAAAVLTTKQ